MKMATKDWIFVAVIVVVLGALLIGKSRQKAGVVPHDDKHAWFYEVVKMGGERMEVEKGCGACHGIQGVPLSKGHPPKEQCLICHTLSRPK